MFMIITAKMIKCHENRKTAPSCSKWGPVFLGVAYLVSRKVGDAQVNKSGHLTFGCQSCPFPC